MNIDEKYKRGMIYTIRNIKDDTLIYVGSTINTLSKRFDGHKRKCKYGKKEHGIISLYNYIENNDWTDWYIELYEQYSCNNKNELERREGQVIREIGTLNRIIAGRSPKEYYEDNIDKIKEQQKEYQQQNADKIKEYLKENADKIKEQKREWRENNKEKIRNHRTQKICCDICGAIISHHNKAKHQRTKTCLAIKNLSNTDISSDSHIADL